MCETIDNKTTSRKFDSQMSHLADSQNFKTNEDPQANPGEGSMTKDKTNMLDCLNSSKSKTNMAHYLNSSDNNEADKRVSEAITNRICNEFNNLFSSTGCFEGTFCLQVKEGNCHIEHNQEWWFMLFKTTERRAGMTTLAANHCPIRC